MCKYGFIKAPRLVVSTSPCVNFLQQTGSYKTYEFLKDTNYLYKTTYNNTNHVQKRKPNVR